MKRLLSICTAAAVAIAYCHSIAAQPAATPVVAGKTMHKATAVPYEGMVKARHRLPAQEGALAANFSCKSDESDVVMWSEGFDNGMGGWIADETEDITWSLANYASDPFTSIDPTNVYSLFVDGPYQVFKRAKSSVTSPTLEVPANGNLKAYIGFSQNFDDECRLYLYVSTDDFVTSKELWNSGNETGELQWRWHPIEVSLAEYAGQEVKLRFTYGPGGEDIFDTGGYMGSFYIDGLQITGVTPIEQISVMTGEVVTFINLSEGEPTSYQWIFPGGTPASSTERNPQVYYTRDGAYDVTLTVSDGTSQDSKTITGFVRVTGTEPTAAIIPPATFRYTETRLPMIAPLVGVEYRDGSTGYPTEWQWSFTGVDAEPSVVFESHEENPVVGYSFLHQQQANLTVSNVHGTSSATTDVSVEYYGTISNFEPGDVATTFSLEDKGVFPGANKMDITAYAEKFSKPSRPILIDGVYVYFTQATATSVADQIANVGVHLYSCKDGLPDKRIESCWWSVFELDLPSAGSSTLVGTAFPFTPQVIDDEFFIVVDGIPEKNDSLDVAFAMARFRDHGNTAYMLKEDEWVDVSTYFPAGENHTSYLIQPSITHSVITLLPAGRDSIEVGKESGIARVPMFSLMGYRTPVETGAEWCRITNIPNGLTVDTLQIEYDALPNGLDMRETTVTLTDSVSTYTFRVIQKDALSSVEKLTAQNGCKLYPSAFTHDFTVTYPEGTTRVETYDSMGRPVYTTIPSEKQTQSTIDGSRWIKGLYIVRLCTPQGAVTMKAMKQ